MPALAGGSQDRPDWGCVESRKRLPEGVRAGGSYKGVSGADRSIAPAKSIVPRGPGQVVGSDSRANDIVATLAVKRIAPRPAVAPISAPAGPDGVVTILSIQVVLELDKGLVGARELEHELTDGFAHAGGVTSIAKGHISLYGLTCYSRVAVAFVEDSVISKNP